FTVQQDLEAARAFYADVKRRAARYGRPPDAIKVLPGVMTVIANTRAEAEDKYEKLQELIQPEIGLKNLSAYFGKDLSRYPLDGPVPDPVWANAEHGRLKVIVELARREKLTIRQLYKRVIGQRAHRTVCGTPAEIADTLEHWFTPCAADGFNILPLTFPQGLDDVVDLLVPELQRRGLFRTDYEGATLRDNLGLARPENRWAIKADAARGQASLAS